MVEFRIDAIVDPSAALRGSAAVERGLLSAQIAGVGLEKTVRRTFAAIGAGVGLRELITTADSFINLENRLRTVIKTEEDLIRVEQELFDISQQTRTSYQANVEVFQRFTSATAALGVSQAELLGVIENLDKAVALSGATAIEASNALRQLTQGLGSGALKGDELRSVLEQLPTVADIIAKELDTTRGGLKKFGEQGKITTQVIVSAFEHAGPQLQAAFEKLVPTVGQSLIVLGNAFLKLIGEINSGTGAFQGLGSAIRLLANNLGTVLTAAASAAAISLVSKLGGALLSLIPTATTAAGVAGGIAESLGVASVAAATNVGFLARLRAAINASSVAYLALGAVIVGSAKVALEAFNEEADLTAQAIDKLNAEGRGLHSIGDQIANVSRELSKFGDANKRALATGAAADRIAQLTQRLKELGEVARQRTKLGITAEDEAAIKKIIDRMNEEVAVLKLSGKEAEKAALIEKEVQTLRQKDKAVSDQAIQQLRERIDFTAQYTVELKVMQGVLNSIKDPSERFELTQLALHDALKAGLLTLDQYRDRLAAARTELEKSKGPQDPFRQQTRSLLDQQPVLALQLRGLDAEAAALEQIQALENQGRKLRGIDKEAIVVLNQQNAALERRVAIAKEILGPQRELALASEDLNRLLEDGTIDADQFGVAMQQAFIKSEESSRTFSDGFDRALRKMSLEATDFASVAESAVNVFADDATNALVQFAETGKFAFKDFARSLLADLTQIAGRLLIVQALTAILGGGAPTVSPGQVPFSFPGEGRASGGPVSGGTPYLVGEHGPEIFTPVGSGNITPSSSAALGPPQVNLQVVNVDDPDHVPSSINRGMADQAIINVLARNRDRVSRILS